MVKTCNKYKAIIKKHVFNKINMLDFKPNQL